MTIYMDALQKARNLADSLKAEYQAKQNYSPTGYRGQLGYMSSVDCLRELKKERDSILKLRRDIAALEHGVDAEFSSICENIGIPFTSGDTRG